MFLCIDPGKNTGWARFNNLYLPTGRGVCKGTDAFIDFMDREPPAKVLIYEDYQLFPHKAIAQVGSRMETAQAIGILKAAARKWDVSELVPYRPGTYKLGMQYAGRRIPRGHIADEESAYFMGIYYLTTHGFITSNNRKLVTRDSLMKGD